MSFKDALRMTYEGVIINIEVTPGSKNTIIPNGYNPWRKRIEVKISQSAQKGKANEQLINEFAHFFKISNSQVMIINGIKNTQKSILIKNIDIIYVISELEKFLNI